MKIQKKIALVGIFLIFLMGMCGCAYWKSEVNSLKGSITGNTYECQFFSNQGERFMTAEGTNIDINNNIVYEKVYTDGGWETQRTQSSVITITIDGSQIESCGSTVLFVEKGLDPDVDFQLTDVKSNAEDMGDYPFVANVVNKYKNMIGKPTVVVIQSQLGDPICAYSGNEVYWEVCRDLPKTTKLMIDGKALYIHRANFEIIDKNLLQEE